jgi:hypothetical protein
MGDPQWLDLTCFWRVLIWYLSFLTPLVSILIDWQILSDSRPGQQGPVFNLDRDCGELSWQTPQVHTL